MEFFERLAKECQHMHALAEQARRTDRQSPDHIRLVTEIRRAGEEITGAIGMLRVGWSRVRNAGQQLQNWAQHQEHEIGPAVSQIEARMHQILRDVEGVEAEWRRRANAGGI